MEKETISAAEPERPAGAIRLVINGIHAKSGGGVTYLRELIPRLAAFPDFEMHLFLHRDQLAQYYPIDENIRVHLFGFSHNRFRTLLWEQFVLPVLTRNMGADIVFSPANYGPVLVRNHVILLRNAVSVFKVAGSVTGKFYWLGVGLATFVSVLTARMALAVSEFAKHELTFGMVNLLADKVRVVPHGTSFRNTEGEPSLRRSPGLLAVSDIYVQKNYHTLLHALAKLLERYPDLDLCIAGQTIDHGYMTYIRQLIGRLKLERHVRFLGRVGVEELNRLYRECRVFVFPSLVETFGNPLLEAMAVGAPIACSRTSAMPEVVGDGAVLFDPNDAGGMAEKIAMLLDDEALCAEISQRAVRRARSFTWEQTAILTRDALCAVAGAEAGRQEHTR